jgi:glycosyltransferase involved in cell wall biosynthesis
MVWNIVKFIAPMLHSEAKIPEPIINEDRSLAPPTPAEYIVTQNAIAKALELVIINPDLKATLIKAGEERIKQFSWEKTAKEYLKLFKSL